MNEYNHEVAWRGDLPIPLAKDHEGMTISCSGILCRKDNNSGLRFMREELNGHLEQVARRYYAGDIAVVDEFLQLYGLGRDGRKSLDRSPAVEGGDS